MHIDPIEKKPFYHFLPGASALSFGTSGCPLHCKFCQNWELSQSTPGDLEAPFTSAADMAGAAVSRRAPVIAFTYNEPTVFTEYLLDVAQAAQARGVRSVMVSCGFANEAPLADICRALSAVKIDLKGFSEEFYRTVCGAELQPVLRSIKQVARSGRHLELVNLVVPTLNDSEKSLQDLAAWVAGELGPDVPVHFTRFHPDYQLMNLPPTPVSTLERARDIAMARGDPLRVCRQRPRARGQSHLLPRLPEDRHQARQLLRHRDAPEERRVRLLQAADRGSLEMKKLLGVASILLALACRGGLGAADQAGQGVREPAVAGQFYPADARSLNATLDAVLKDATAPGPEAPIAIVAPHAGWVFSGQIAADAWRQTAGRQYDTIVILGTNHTGAGLRADRRLPGQRVPDAARRRARGHGARRPRSSRKTATASPDPSAHAKEHSIEVHVPFAQRLFPDAQIVAVVVGSEDAAVLTRFGRTLARLLQGRRALIVASSDLSHYPSWRDANVVDRRTIEAIASLDPDRFRAAAENGVRGAPNLDTCACGDGADPRGDGGGQGARRHARPRGQLRQFRRPARWRARPRRGLRRRRLLGGRTRRGYARR